MVLSCVECEGLTYPHINTVSIAFSISFPQNSPLLLHTRICLYGVGNFNKSRAPLGLGFSGTVEIRIL